MNFIEESKLDLIQELYYHRSIFDQPKLLDRLPVHLVRPFIKKETLTTQAYRREDITNKLLYFSNLGDYGKHIETFDI